MTIPTIHLQTIRQTFDASTAVSHTLVPHERNTAVALIFYAFESGLALCMGQRAPFDGDPWSGDMALPGGKGEPQDATFHDIASRETFEETGLQLDPRQLAGSLPAQRTHGTSTRRPLLLRPMIYILSSPPPPFRLNHELTAAFWIPVGHLWDRANWVSDVFEWNGRAYAGIQYQDQIIWGLTLRILAAFGEEIGVPLPAAFVQKN